MIYEPMYNQDTENKGFFFFSGGDKERETVASPAL